MVTPFNADGAVDYGRFWQLARFLAGNGSDGLLVSGTTGESPTLSSIEKTTLFKAAVDAVGAGASGERKAWVIAGTGTYDTRESIALTERAADIGCDAVLAVTPYYSRPPQEGLYRHFAAIAEATDLPLVLYNIPGRTARLIEVETMVRLSEHPGIVATKDAVDDIDYTEREISAVQSDFAVYAGSDHMILPIVRAGGVGVISVASHLAGPAIARLVEAGVSGDDDEAQRIDDALKPLYEALFLEPNPMPLKGGLNALWDDVGSPRLPLLDASPQTIKLIEEAMVAATEV